MIPRLSRSVARELGYYVYLYVHPETNEVLYVGKGKGSRVLSHVRGSHNARHAKALRALKRKGLLPRIDILVHGLRSEETANAVEAAVIDAIGLDQLTNAVRGWQSRRRGRMSLDHCIGLYGHKPARIREPSILIRINRLYRFGMTDTELYDATRAAWVVGKRRERAEYAFAIYQGVIREVYRITGWHPGGSTYNARWPQGSRRPGRWEFVGVIAEDRVRKRYLNKSVVDEFQEGCQNPIMYANC